MADQQKENLTLATRMDEMERTKRTARKKEAGDAETEPAKPAAKGKGKGKEAAPEKTEADFVDKYLPPHGEAFHNTKKDYFIKRYINDESYRERYKTDYPATLTKIHDSTPYLKEKEDKKLKKEAELMYQYFGLEDPEIVNKKIAGEFAASKEYHVFCTKKKPESTKKVQPESED